MGDFFYLSSWTDQGGATHAPRCHPGSSGDKFVEAAQGQEWLPWSLSSTTTAQPPFFFVELYDDQYIREVHFSDDDEGNTDEPAAPDSKTD